MKFFASKNRGGKRDSQLPPHGPAGEVEAHTDLSRKDYAAQATGTREMYGDATTALNPKRKIAQVLLKSPTSRQNASRGEKEAITSPRSAGRGRAADDFEKSPSTHSNHSNHSHTPNGRPATVAPSPRRSPRPDDRAAITSPRQPQPQSGGAAAAAANRAKAHPTSILHKNTHYGHDTRQATAAAAKTSSPLFAAPPLPLFSMGDDPAAAPHTRVRFMSAGDSVASTEASQPHLMAGGANSVASSSAMSSSEGNRENVFDRVLNMVMAEEHERLNAMGMAPMHNRDDSPGQERGRLSAVDAKAKAAVAAPSAPHVMWT